MQEHLNQLALEIDNALDNEADLNQFNAFLQIIEKMSKEENINSFEKAQLNFYAANIYSHLINIESENSEHLENEIYHLRLASSAFKLIPQESHNTDLPFRVETNLGNSLDYIGRFVEALECYDSVIEKHPYFKTPYGNEVFAMAHANKGMGLLRYIQRLYDENQKNTFGKASYTSLKTALDLGVELHAEESCRNKLDYLNSLYDWDNMPVDMDKKLNYRSKKERLYRQWSLDNRLFLNPLNDILKTSYETYDNLHIPSIVTPISEETPEIYGIYNQLKQEYISARYFLFEAIEESKKYSVHFSDKQVYLVDMLDARFYRLWVEKMKMSFLAAYAIFDKIAYLINEYWQLQLPIDRVDFRKVWFEKLDITKGINAKFQLDKNLPLKGLYWLSKDIFYKNDKRPIEPDSKQLNYIRNHISHKYLKVQHSSNNPASWRKNSGDDYPIDEKELQEQTIKLLKLVRSALIYVSLAINWQEKNNPKTERNKIVGVSMANVDDNQRW